MKKILALLLVAALAVGASACSSSQPSSSQESSSVSESVSSEESAPEEGAPEESAPENAAPEFTVPEENQRLGDILTAARNAEDNEYNPPILSTEDPAAAMIFEIMGLPQEDVSAFAISVSPMNVKAYGVAILTPAEGKAEAVFAAANKWVEAQRQSFENYLPDQYEVAKAATVEQLEDGTVVLVMSEDSATVQKAIVDGLKA